MKVPTTMHQLSQKDKEISKIRVTILAIQDQEVKAHMPRLSKSSQQQLIILQVNRLMIPREITHLQNHKLYSRRPLLCNKRRDPKTKSFLINTIMP